MSEVVTIYVTVLESGRRWQTHCFFSRQTTRSLQIESLVDLRGNKGASQKAYKFQMHLPF